MFHEGRIQQLAPPRVLYEEPENAFVAGFIGENNRLVGVVRELRGGLCRVETPLGWIWARAVRCGAVGEPTLLSLRPERLLLEPAQPVANRWSGQIRELIYHGDHWRVRLCHPSGVEMILKLPNQPGQRTLMVGEEVEVGFAAEDCRALDAPSGIGPRALRGGDAEAATLVDL